MRKAKQSTAKNVMVLMVDAADHITGKTGLTLTITASKDGAAFASISPTVTERGSGWYSVALTAAHTDTLGDLALHVTAAGADPADMVLLVEAGATDVDVSTRLATASYTAPLDAAGTRGALGMAAANLDAQLAAISAFIDTEVAAILAAVDTEVGAIKAKTDNLPASPAATGDQMALTAAAIDAILDDPIEGTVTLRQMIRGFAAALLAKLSGADINSPVFRDILDTKDRISATTDAAGNRLAVTLDLT